MLYLERLLNDGTQVDALRAGRLDCSGLKPEGSGVRAQALDDGGRLLDDLSIMISGNLIHVCSVPSAAATASLVIGKHIVDMAQKTMNLAEAHRAFVPAPAEQASSD